MTFTPGPIQFSHEAPMLRTGSSTSVMVLGRNSVSLPSDSYIVIESELSSMDESERQRVILAIAETAGLLTLRIPHLLSERIYEGAINTAHASVLFREGPLRLSVGPPEVPEEILDQLRKDATSTSQVTDEQHQRFQLASRWYRRGCESLNLVDKFLFLWTVVEMYPGRGKSNVVKNLAAFLQDSVYPGHTVEYVKDALEIGPIYGERKRIVHEGQALVPSSDSRLQNLLDKLQGIATVSLRLLGGLPPGDALDEYFQDSE